jgi:hypothetical protein
MPARALLLLLLLYIRIPAIGQTIHGEVVDEGRKPLQGVNIHNIHTMLDVTADEHGSFIIAASSDQLIEFKKAGYKTARVRIPQGYIPPYFRIIMKKGIPEIKRDDYLARGNRYNYTHDSIVYHELYKSELDFPKMSAIDMMQSPFTAMSRHNREVWQFQDDFSDFEKEKYVDRTFNAELITTITGLKGDSLHYFMRRYRPGYEQLKAMNDYTFFNFIKASAHKYRTPDRPRGAQ